MKNPHIEQASIRYRVPDWGDGYFTINDQGHVVVRPRRDGGPEIDLYKVACEQSRHHLSLPVLVRFTDILHDRVDRLHRSFAMAARQHGYKGGYTSLYPIKVNQQHSIVEEFVNYGQARVGLEAGSKPELLAVLGISRDDGVIVCNGYKDREYVRLALYGQMMGHRVFIVIEKFAELQLVLHEARQLGIRPCLGLRVRLASIGAGNWQNSGGDKSKFGLSVSQILDVVAELGRSGQLDCLQLLHFHLGSQLVDIKDIKRGIHECARFYANLYEEGVKIEYVDVGGGLGIDYEGSGSRNPCSMNYSIEAYADNIISTLANLCEKSNIPHPHVFTESGRAMTAHHAILITNVIDVEKVPDGEPQLPASDSHESVQALWQKYAALAESDSDESVRMYKSAVALMTEIQQQFNQGKLSLQQRARAEEIHFAICHRVQRSLLNNSQADNDILHEISIKLTDKYFCNFSLFQSVPDIWGIEQIFPVMPLHRLDEEADRDAMLEDITCDSDGRIDTFVSDHGLDVSLRLHEPRSGEDYLLGIFLVGAYQEILGDMHNLFGDTDSLQVSLDEEGGYRFYNVTQGDSVDSVLRYVHFNPEVLLENYRHKILVSGMDKTMQETCLHAFENGLHGYTYLEK